MTISGLRKDVVKLGSVAAFLIVHVGALAFAAGVVWQKLDHIETELSTVKGMVATYAEDRVNMVRTLEGLNALRSRVDRIERRQEGG